MIGLIITIIIFCSTTAFFMFKYFRLKNEVDSYKEIGTGRVGFYKYISGGGSYRAYVYIKELDRYTNGYSKIKIDKIDPTSSSAYTDDSIKGAKESFNSLKITSEIEWLESEDHIKKVRKEKLESLKKL